MNESFGARLRRRREEHGIDLIAIAEQTKIKQSLLEALERDDVSHWPSGIFRRAFIRAYAQGIGLNPDAVVREFLEVHPEPAEVVETVAAIASLADSGRVNGAPPTRLHQIVGSAIGSFARLRRGPAPQHAAVVDEAATRTHAPAGPGLSTPAPPLARHVDLLNEAAAVDDAPVVEQTSPDPDLDAGAGSSAPRHVDPPNEAAAADGTRVDEPASPEPEPGFAERPQPEPPPVDPDREAAACAPANGPVMPEPDLLDVAHLCTEISRVENTDDIQPLLQEAARILDATGLIVWIWDAIAEGLRPALVHGYSDKVIAQLPTVGRDADNATAGAFRSARTCAISGGDGASGALVVPMQTPGGCGGVLAIELPHGREQATSVRAVATIIAALLAQLMGDVRPADAPTAGSDDARGTSRFFLPVTRSGTPRRVLRRNVTPGPVDTAAR